VSKIRRERTAEQIRLILSELFLRNVSDPRLQGLTVTSVTIDRELQYADIYVNALGDEERESEVIGAVGRAVPYLRHQLAARLTLRNVPVLHFHWDPSLAHAMHMADLLDSLNIPDEEEE